MPVVTASYVTSGLTATICDRVASGLNLEVTHMARIGYARVSTLDQDLKSQHDRLRAEGCEIVRSEKKKRRKAEKGGKKKEAERQMKEICEMGM